MNVTRRPGGRLAALALLVPVLAGCGGKSVAKDAWVDPNPLPADTATMQTAEIGVHGGRFVIAATSGPKTFNAIIANETSTTDMTGRMFTSLVDWNYETHQDYGLLAKTWERSADGLTYTFHLRHGLRFSDGHPLTAEDVLFSAQVTIDPKVGTSTSSLLQSGGKLFEFSAPDSYTVVVKLAKPHRMATAAIGSIRVMPKHRLEAAWKAGAFAAAYNTSTPPESIVTSGAWMLKSHRANEESVLARNPWWFQTDAAGHRLPYLDEVVFVVVPDQAGAALKFQAGEVDGLDNVKNEDYKTLADGQQQGHYTLHDVGTSLNTNFMWFNLNRVREARPGKRVGDPWVDPVKYAWFSNPVFRRAVSYAIDRDAIIRGPFFGDGVKNWAGITAGNPAWAIPDLVHYDHDPAKAKELLASLGWKDSNGDGILEDTGGHKVSFAVKTNGDNNMRMSMLTLIRDDLAKVGIEIVPAGVDFNTLISNMRSDFQYDAALLGLGSAVPPDPGMGMNFWRSSGLTHYWDIRQPKPDTPEEARIDSLADAHLGSLTDEEALRTYAAMQTIVNEQCWVIYLPSQVVRLPVRNRFGNFKPSVIPHRLLWNIEQVFVKPRAGRA